MWGSIIGDLAGSIYEFDQYKKISNIKIDKIIPQNSFYSDDTILTIAILDATLNDNNYEYYLKTYIKNYANYTPEFSPYFKNPFSPGTTNWALNNGESNSIGNGAMMRISPVGYLFNTEEDVIKNARLATIPSHNTKEAIDCATTVALIIFYARHNYAKEQIINKLNIKLTYSPFNEFNMTCYKTIDNCLYALFTSNSFNESITKIISYGGDTDTNACIVGSMAEALYGIDELLIKEASNKVPHTFVEKLNQGYKKIKKLSTTK